METAVAADAVLIKQHLIDPEICIRCNTCEATCPVGAITHDDRNYVVRADVCNLCMACISPCPTGSIDNWRTMPKVRAYPIEEQLLWDELPPELSADQLAAEGVAPEVVAAAAAEPVLAVKPEAANGEAPFNSAAYGATVPPWSAAHAYTNLFGPNRFVYACAADQGGIVAPYAALLNGASPAADSGLTASTGADAAAAAASGSTPSAAS